jgi:hypothetical protein
MIILLWIRVVIIWKLDLQLPVQSVPITTNVVSSNPVHGEVYSIQHYVIKFVSMSSSKGFRFRFMMFNTTFNNISVISWQSVLLVEEMGMPGENQ